jgi:flagellar basal-body rod modification protein FlgD
MTVSNLSSISQATNPSKSETARKSLGSDLDLFLKLMTTQLQNQDPTEPLDTNQLTDQITQFTQVEQQVQTNTNLETLLASQKQSQLSTAVSFIGSEVETAGNTGEFEGGRAVFSYNQSAPSATTDIVITDAAGRAVFKGNGTTVVGRNLVVWDGVNSFSGQQEPPGTYTITVTAKTAAGKPVATDARAVGVVTTVETASDGNILLGIGGRTVKYSDVLAVRTPTLAGTGT